MFSKNQINKFTGNYSQQIEQVKEKLNNADVVVIGAGAGLSTSAGFTYSGERFYRYFSDFSERYGITDMYSGGFMVMRYPTEVFWAYWSRLILINRYEKAPKPVYDDQTEIGRTIYADIGELSAERRAVLLGRTAGRLHV